MTHLDPNLAQKIVHEVKFQGVFDEFRKDSIADVDTKPAYLNLRQRVESAVQKFLSEQRWTPDTNKYQLRDRLRRHITESGFLDVGVERIVDQVVNPKIGSVFQPRIEEIAYKYLGLPPPAKRELPPMPLTPFPTISNANHALKIETSEANESENLLPKDLEQVSPDSDKTAVLEDEKMEDEEDESPPFEPITECKSPIKIEKSESTDNKVDIKTEVEEKRVENEVDEKPPALDASAESEQMKPQYQTTTPVKDECPSVDGLASQESQLSQVSSETTSNQLNQSGSDPPTNLENAATANISEEAQMPKFNENSTEAEEDSKKNSDLHFDIKKDEIKFEGTERKPNYLDGEQNESINDEPPIIDSAFSAVDIESKGAFHFAKLVKVEPCNTQDPASSVSSQDDTSSAQLCIVEKSEQDLLQTDTNSLQKPLPDESVATTLNSSQTKVNDEKHKSKSSSTSSSRHKKSSKSSRRSPERSHRYEDKDQRDRSNKYNDRHSDSRHTSKHHHSSGEKHTSSSKGDEKRSSSSRSESQSRHSSSVKKDHRDRHDSKKHRSSHKSHRSDKDSYKPRKSTSADDHNEVKDKPRRRKSTDSNDEDKSPSGQNGTTNSANNNIKSISEANSSATTTTNTTKSTNNDSNKHSKDHKQKSATSNKSTTHDKDKVNISSSMVVVVNEILTDPTLGFVELETKAKVSTTQSSIEEDGELLYFEHDEIDLQLRVNMLDEAINRCTFAYKAFDQSRQVAQDFNHLDSSRVTEPKNNNNNTEINKKMAATLQVDCYEYAGSHSEGQQSSSANELATDSEEPPTIKRFKFDTECDTSAKKTVVSKRVDIIAKQRYSSEDLYKPRPILGQRMKRRGLDA